MSDSSERQPMHSLYGETQISVHEKWELRVGVRFGLGLGLGIP